MAWGRRPSKKSAARAGRGIALLLAGGMAQVTAAESPAPDMQIQRPEEPPSIVAASAPTPTLATFGSTLACVDDLLQKAGVRDVHVTVAGIPDEEGRMIASRDGMVTVLSAMSLNSEAFRVIDFDTSQGDLAQLFTDVTVAGANRLVLPTYYLRGTMTSRHAPWPPTANTAMTVHALDLHVGLTQTRTYVPGVATRLTLTLFEPDENGLVQGRILSRDGWALAGLFTTSHHLNEPAQTLVELGLAEVVGKLARVPYRTCLPLHE